MLPFSNFTSLLSWPSKKVKNNSTRFLNWRLEENLIWRGEEYREAKTS